MNYRIAELNVSFNANHDTLSRQAEKYAVPLSLPEAEINIRLETGEQMLLERQKENPHLSLDDCEYIWTGFEFYTKLLGFEGFVLHSSAVVLDGNAYLFSAKSGTGKSTHTGLWQEFFGEDKAQIINDDKPAIRLTDGQFHVYGTPWSGKTDKNLDVKAPLRCIVFIEQSPDNWIRRIEAKEALKLVMEQTVRSRQLDRIDSLCLLLDQLLKTIPVYRMGCTISEDAVKLAYETIK